MLGQKPYVHLAIYRRLCPLRYFDARSSSDVRPNAGERLVELKILNEGKLRHPCENIRLFANRRANLNVAPG
jgi:hypothetical protein